MKKAVFRQKYAVDETKEVKVVNSKVEKVEEEPKKKKKVRKDD